ncbi:MAG: aminotransferase class I/II-fold pyridoxal phosphate-dependent enzyme [Acidimicrobiales bacterium]
MISLNQERAPYFEALCEYAGVPRAVFHTPGHIQGRGGHDRLADLFGAKTLELDLCTGLGNLDGKPGSALEQAQELAAAAYGADRSWFLVNGSTSGNQAMVISVCHPGDVILTSRNTHKAIVSALILAGVRPVYLPPELDPASHIAHGVTLETVRAGLEAHPQAKAVLIVSPTYYGTCCDVAGIAEVAHGHGIPLLVDEAWGPHLPFHDGLPSHAMALGADAAVTGAHKLIGAVTQASMLHVQGSFIDQDRVEVVSKLLLSTSPSCLLYASLDVARMQMATEGEILLHETIALAEEARAVLGEHPRLSCIDKRLVGQYGVEAVDPTRLCVNVVGTGHTGYEVDRILFDSYGVAVEMSDFANVLANITIGHDRHTVGRLVSSLLEVADKLHDPAPPKAGFLESGLVHLPAQVLSPTEAFHAPQERVPLRESAGRVAAEMAASYPPGIPVVVPGERLTPELVEYLALQVEAGCRIVGPRDPALGTIQVVRE